MEDLGSQLAVLKYESAPRPLLLLPLRLRANIYVQVTRRGNILSPLSVRVRKYIYIYIYAWSFVLAGSLGALFRREIRLGGRWHSRARKSSFQLELRMTSSSRIRIRGIASERLKGIAHWTADDRAWINYHGLDNIFPAYSLSRFHIYMYIYKFFIYIV